MHALKKILIIDDDLTSRVKLKAILDKAGYEAITADNGLEGTKYISTEKPDLVVTDIFMPDKDGLETVSELTERYPDLPIIAMSGGGKTIDDFLPIAADLGAKVTLKKPIGKNELLAAINACLS